MNEELTREVRESLFLHRPLPLHREREFEARLRAAPIAASRPLGGTVRAEGAAEAAGLSEAGGVYTITAPLRCAPWPPDTPGDVGYRNFGVARLVFRFPAEDWRPFDRLRFSVRGRIDGAHALHLNAAVVSGGAVPVPDRYWREGATVFDLDGADWNDCLWEFGSLSRDAVRELQLYVFCAGSDPAAGDSLTYSFRDLRLERVRRDASAAVYPGAAETIHTRGWENPTPGIRCSTAGYFPDGAKTAVATTEAASFTLTDERGSAVLTAPVRRVENERGRFTVFDFSEIRRPGRYRLEAGPLRSAPFTIGEALGEEALWRALNFLFCQRCGYPVPGRHAACHLDFLGEHNGETIPFWGGWHDAADTSQQAAQTAETVETLCENAQRRGGDLRRRLLEEAGWGLDFILRTRFGDGFRVTSAGSTRWSDNRLGTFDDVRCRVFDHSFENFLFASAEAAAARAFADDDAPTAARALRAAREDYDFAMSVFLARGVEGAHMFEHTYNSGASQYYAVIVRAASALYRLTGDARYADDARGWGERLLLCQERRDLPFAGFFYRDETHRTPVHFNHQAREHQFAEALAALCRTQPRSPRRAAWEEAMRRYGAYLKYLSGHTAPYGMLPAGVHRREEADDAALFPFLHVTCSYEDERGNYAAQLGAGRDLGGGFVLRNFPVWFSFRGNNAVLLSMGRAAGVLGRALGDEALTQLCREQLYWLWGKNPFGQSLMYGMGADYARLYTVHMGETVGAVPVGIETYENEDAPYWPGENNATYREIWIGAVCRCLEAVAALSGDPDGEES